MITRIQQRSIRAFTTLPKQRDWLELAFAGILFTAVTVPFGLATGLLEFTDPKDSLFTILAYVIVALVLPSSAEEWIFRGLLLPHKEEHVTTRQRLAWCAMALVLFVLWHPFNAWLFVPWARVLFYRLDFLLVAGLLGLVATALYQRSGSIWPGVIFHWTAVVGWKLFCGGKVITPGLHNAQVSVELFVNFLIGKIVQ